MTRGRRFLVLPSLLPILLLAAVSAHAAEQAGDAAVKATELFQWINFAIVLAVLIWIFGKLLPPKFRKNAEDISSAIEKAAAAKAEAERQLREAEEKLAKLDQEVARIRSQAQHEAAAEAERIRQLTKSDAQRIRAAAKAEIEAAERAARLQLKAAAAKLAVDEAESMLQRQLNPQIQEALLANFVKSLESRAN
jgi:F-type H+-transporting ATPase subunit b